MKVYIAKADVDAREVSSDLFKYFFELETGLKVQYDHVKRDANGKPIPEGGVYFNLSHSGPYWCIAFDGHECGVDIEVKRKLNARIVRHILAANEKPLGNDILKTWVAKEAFSKYKGDGVLMDFTSFTVMDAMRQCEMSNLSTKSYYCYVAGKKNCESASFYRAYAVKYNQGTVCKIVPTPDI